MEVLSGAEDGEAGEEPGGFSRLHWIAPRALRRSLPPAGGK